MLIVMKMAAYFEFRIVIKLLVMACIHYDIPAPNICQSLEFFFSFPVSDSLFSSAGYTFGAPTPPPGSPYSPVQVTQLELLTKGFNHQNIIIQQQPDYHHPPSPKKAQQIHTVRNCLLHYQEISVLKNLALILVDLTNSARVNID